MEAAKLRVINLVPQPHPHAQLEAHETPVNVGSVAWETRIPGTPHEA